MDRVAQLSIGPLSASGSFSLHSLAEGSEVISEVEEIHEVLNLQKRGDAALRKRNFAEALQCYSEALEIDSHNVEALTSRATVYLKMQDFQAAQQNAEKLLTLQPSNAHGHYLLGTALMNLKQHEEALAEFLCALGQNPDTEQELQLSSNIAALLPHFTDVSDDVMHQILGMEPYKQLCEVGCVLYRAKQYALSIRVLSAAQFIQTNQQGITLKLLLTLANCHSALSKFDVAIAMYQECLRTAVAAHDTGYQTKCLASLGSLHTELGDMYQAIVNYQRLLDLQAETAVTSDPQALALHRALHLNLSIAYKKIGDVRKAVKHAKILSELLKDETGADYMKSQCLLNVGILHELLGEYVEALENYTGYLNLCKKQGDTKGTAMAYGRLGGAYMDLYNYTLSMTYHEQHVSLANKLKDGKMQCEAHQLTGDSYMKMECYEEAIQCYMNMLQTCPRKDLHMQVLALCKTGLAYREQHKFQYSLYYYEQAKMLAEDLNYQDMRQMCELNEACILQNSTQVHELDQARAHFLRLIPLLQEEMRKHTEEDTLCPRELPKQVLDCYDGMQTVLAKMAKKEECLQYAETYRQKPMLHFMSKEVTGAKLSPRIPTENITIEKIKKTVTEANVMVIYYSVLETMLLIWVIKPGFGIVRFYNSKWTNKDITLQGQLEVLIGELCSQEEVDLSYSAEHRALPLRDAQLDRIRRKNNKLCDDQPYETESEASSTLITSQSRAASEKPPERQLFDHILAPVDDLLTNLDEQSPLVIIPDKILTRCPFSVLKDWDSRTLGSKFRLTVLPSLLALEKVTQNHMNQIKLQDELERERSNSRLGGYHKLRQENSKLASGSLQRIPEFSRSQTDINPRRTSNPRLLNMGDLQSSLSHHSKKTGLSRDSTFVSVGTTNTSITLKLGATSVSPPAKTQSLRKTRALGTSTSLERLHNLGHASTLTTRSSTNTDITAADYGVTDFAQISNKDRAVVIGSPSLPDRLALHRGTWKAVELHKAQAECQKIGEMLQVTPVLGRYASKDTFIKQALSATLLHIATYCCLDEGWLVVSPNPGAHDDTAPQSAYIMTTEEIAMLSLKAKLVVLSGGWNVHSQQHPKNSLLLPSAFLAAGAQSVLMLMWPVPTATLNKFYQHFYTSLHQGNWVTQAVNTAAKCVMEDDRYEDVCYWAPYTLVGQDVYLNTSDIKHAMLDQTLDEIEDNYVKQSSTTPLQPKPAFPKVLSLLEKLEVLQGHIKNFVAQGVRDKSDSAVDAVITLMDTALKCIHNKAVGSETIQLPVLLTDNKTALDLLAFLGFHFQFQGKERDIKSPYVLMPHCDEDSLLMITFDSLRSLIDLMESQASAQALQELLPLNQEMISNLVDVLCITKHAGELQLKVTDATVKPLWKTAKVRKLLMSMGYHQVGPLLSQEGQPIHRKLLTSCLQLLICLSLHKSASLLHKLDVALLGHHFHDQLSTASSTSRLPSLSPLLLPRAQIRMSTPWVSAIENEDEMIEKIKLAKRLKKAYKEFSSNSRQAEIWHANSLVPQANEMLNKVGRSEPRSVKVKVISGSSGSFSRVPVDHEIKLDLSSIAERRDYAHYILRDKLEQLAVKHKDNTHKLYLPYVCN